MTENDHKKEPLGELKHQDIEKKLRSESLISTATDDSADSKIVLSRNLVDRCVKQFFAFFGINRDTLKKEEGDSKNKS